MKSITLWKITEPIPDHSSVAAGRCALGDHPPGHVLSALETFATHI